MLMTADLVSRRTAGEQVDEARIQAALGAYPAEHRYLFEGRYQNRTLTALARPFAHPFHEPWVRHFTREHAVVYATQASYLLVASAIHAGDFPGLSIDGFLTACRAEEALITSMSLRFHQRAAVPDRVPIHAEMDSLRRIHDSLHFHCTYEISDIVSLEAWLRTPRGAAD